MPTIDSLIEEHKKEAEKKHSVLHSEQEVKYLEKNSVLPRLSLLITIILVAILIPFLLNYFNIISLSDRFPSLFSWLPTEGKKIEITPQPLPVPSSLPLFTNDVPENVKVDLQQLVSDVVLSSHIPTSLEFHKINMTDTTNQSILHYTVSFTNNSSEEFRGVISYEKKPTKREFSISKKDGLSETFSAQGALTLTNKYLTVAIKEQFICRIPTPKTKVPTGAVYAPNFGVTTQCDSMWTSGIGKEGVTVTSNPKTGIQILYCEILDEKKAQSANSCLE